MASTCVAILSPGDMGHAVGALLAERGFRLVSALTDRSELTRARAERAGIEDAGDLDGVVRAAEGILAILPPAEAEPLLQKALKIRRGALGEKHPPLVDSHEAESLVPRVLENFEREAPDLGLDVFLGQDHAGFQILLFSHQSVSVSSVFQRFSSRTSID